MLYEETTDHQPQELSVVVLRTTDMMILVDTCQ